MQNYNKSAFFSLRIPECEVKNAKSFTLNIFVINNIHTHNFDTNRTISELLFSIAIASKTT